MRSQYLEDLYRAISLASSLANKVDSAAKVVFGMGTSCVIYQCVEPQPANDDDCMYHVGKGKDRIARVCPVGKPGDIISVPGRLLTIENTKIIHTFEGYVWEVLCNAIAIVPANEDDSGEHKP